ncbi:MAG: insulinase family protein [Myxococcota bacterium]
MNAKRDPMQVVEATLDNGLRVYLSVNPEQPRVAARVSVRAGAAEDPRDATGIAHYLEHMLANKGTRKLGTTDFSAEAPYLDQIRALYDQLGQMPSPEQAAALYQRIDAAGVAASRYAIPNELKQLYGLLGARRLNAYTSHDQTTYVVDIPANRLEQWAMLESDRFRHPVFRSFQTEVETVFEEKNRSLDNPDRRLSAALSRALWGAHPYGAEILGESEHLRRPSVSRMEAFFSTWYVPNNMAVVLAGALDPDAALALVERYFGALTPRPLPSRARAVPDIPTGGRRVRLQHPGLPEMCMAWRSVAWSDPRRPAAALADMLLDNRSTGLLDRNLNIPQRVRRVGAYPRFMREAGAEVLWGRPRTGQTLEEVEQLLLEQIERVQQGAFEAEELSAIILDYEISYLKGLEDNASRAGMLLRCFLHDQPWQGVEAELDVMRAVTPAQIRDMAQEIFQGPRVTVFREDGPATRPAPLAPPITGRKIQSSGHSDFFQTVQQTPSAPPPLQTLAEGQDFQRWSAPGVNLIASKNPHNHLFQLTIQAPVGRNEDPRWGIGWSLWGRSGAGGQDRAALEQTLYRAGLGLSVGTGHRVTDLKLTGPREAMDLGLRVLKERVHHPNLAEADARRAIEDAIAHRRQAKSDRRTQIKALQQRALYGTERSPFLGRTLSDDDLRAVSFSETMARIQDIWSAPWEAGFVGSAPASAVLARLQREDVSREGSIPTDGYRMFSGAEVWVAHHDAVQASVTVLCPQSPYDPKKAALIQLYNEYMGGSAGVVFQEIREARGMAYSAQASWSLGWQRGDQNLLWASAGTQADKAAAVSALLVEMLREMPIQPARWARARASAVAKLRTSWIRFRNLPSTIASWNRRGYPSDPRPHRLEELHALTFDDLQAHAAPLREAPMIVAIVGDVNRMDLGALGQIAPVRPLALDELFAY